MRRGAVWAIAAVGLAVSIAAITVAAHYWAGVCSQGCSGGISPAGWIALVLGVLASLALGVGLMALMFFSSRRGYDEIRREDRD